MSAIAGAIWWVAIVDHDGPWSNRDRGCRPGDHHGAGCNGVVPGNRILAKARVLRVIVAVQLKGPTASSRRGGMVHLDHVIIVRGRQDEHETRLWSKVKACTVPTARPILDDG